LGLEKTMKKSGLGCLMVLGAGWVGNLWAQGAASSLAAGDQAYQARNYAQAEQNYYDALKLDPRSAQAYEGVGDCEYMMGNKAEALKAFEKSLTLAPANYKLRDFAQSLRSQLSAGGPPSSGKLATDKEIEETEAEEKALEKDIDAATPFKPYWENEFQLSVQNQQEGQSTNTLSYIGTYHLDKGGDTLGGQAQGIHQKVEGSASSIGALAVDGGLGIDAFTPSLTVGVQGGQNQWRQLNGTLTLDEQLWDPLSLSFVIGGNVGSHSGTFSQVYSASATFLNLTTAQANALLNNPVRIDTDSWNASLGPVFTPWDWWSLSPTVGYEYDDTFQFQISGPKKTLTIPLTKENEAVGTYTLTLTMDFTLFKGFVLEAAPQVGEEYYPAGLAYSNTAGGLVYHATSTTVDFTGGTLSVSYSFE
jgi:tetratricopeptide (TPR) repeat protein